METLFAMKKAKFKALLAGGIGNLVSGIFFGTGCIIIEHIDNTWWQAKDPAQSEEVATAENEPSSPPTAELASAD